jgi:hypothetical protein
MKLATLIAVILLVGNVCVLSAQPVDTLRSAKEAVAAQLRVNDLVRVRSIGRQFQGVFLGYEWPELRLNTGTQSLVVLLPEVDGIWVRGQATKRGALLGTLVGVVVGGAVGLYVGEVICDDSDCQANTLGTIATFGALGAVGGAGSGALVGLTVPQWHTRFP